ncbi:MAG: hypothetical protein ABJ251_11260 [Paracoccaceae bacterium]
MGLANAISAAKTRELSDLSAYVASEIEMEGVNVGEGDHRAIAPEAIAAALKAWAYMQQNSADGDV